MRGWPICSSRCWATCSAALPAVQRRALEAALLLSEEREGRRRINARSRRRAWASSGDWPERGECSSRWTTCSGWIRRRRSCSSSWRAGWPRNRSDCWWPSATAGDGVAPLGLGRADLDVVPGPAGAAEHGSAAQASPRPDRRDAHTAGAAQSPRGLGREPVLRARAGARLAGQGRPDPARPSPAGASDARGDPARAPRGAADARTRRRAAAAALARPTESILGDSLALEQAAEAGVIELADGDSPLQPPAARLGRLHVDRSRGAAASAPPARRGGQRSRGARPAPGARRRKAERGGRLRPRRRCTRGGCPRRTGSGGGAGRARGAPDAGNRPEPAAAAQDRGGHAITFQPGSSPRAQRFSSVSPRRCLPAARERTRCCCSRARNRASSGASSSRRALWTRLGVTTPASRRSSATSPSSTPFRSLSSRRSSTPAQRWRPQRAPATTTSRDCALDRRLVRDAAGGRAHAGIAGAGGLPRDGR